MENSMVGLWGHSLGSAVTARIIAKKMGLDEPEEISVAALLHDIGKVVMNLKFPDKYGVVMADAEKNSLFIYEAEEKHFEINHAQSGSWIAQKWNFPKSLIEVIGYHHKPHLSKNVPLQTAIVHVADILIRACGFGFAGDNYVPQVHPSAWELLKFSADDIKDVLKEMDEALVSAEDFLHLED
ncbi:MAG: HDOD domain-containing protein [Nitrospirae bacterium]|nr:HDOD domain-containing protein [Nitrospirota bacterium]